MLDIYFFEILSDFGYILMKYHILDGRSMGYKGLMLDVVLKMLLKTNATTLVQTYKYLFK